MENKWEETEFDTDDSDNDTGSDHATVRTGFISKNQGQWVAVYYDKDLNYIGQVLQVTSQTRAFVKFLDTMKGMCDFFKWPASDDITETDNGFGISWDFDGVFLHSSDGQVWAVPKVKTIEKKYMYVQVYSLNLGRCASSHTFVLVLPSQTWYKLTVTPVPLMTCYFVTWIYSWAVKLSITCFSCAAPCYLFASYRSFTWPYTPVMNKIIFVIPYGEKAWKRDVLWNSYSLICHYFVFLTHLSLE